MYRFVCAGILLLMVSLGLGEVQAAPPAIRADGVGEAGGEEGQADLSSVHYKWGWQRPIRPRPAVAGVRG